MGRVLSSKAESPMSDKIKKKRNITLSAVLLFLLFLLIGMNLLVGTRLAERPRTGENQGFTKTKSLAVIHMGIHKTGSSSLQAVLSSKAEFLISDGYFMPYREQEDQTEGFKKHLNGDRLSANQVNFATCFADFRNPERVVFPCDPDLLLNGLIIANRNDNLLVSAETFWTINEKGMKRLAEYLSHWDDVIIIIYYRHFFDWIRSVFNQQTKGRTFNDTQKWEESGEKFAVTMERLVDSFRGNYIAAFVSKISNYFGDVRVFNYHDGDTVESFLCHALPNAKEICNAYVNETKPQKTNTARALYFSDLAYAAKKAGLVDIFNEQDMENVTQAVKDHFKSLDMTSNNFKKKCLSQEALEKIWAITLENEVALFPERNATDELRAGFEKAATTSLCTFDFETTLNEEGWKSFFQSYKAGAVGTDRMKENN